MSRGLKLIPALVFLTVYVPAVLDEKLSVAEKLPLPAVLMVIVRYEVLMLKLLRFEELPFDTLNPDG